MILISGGLSLKQGFGSQTEIEVRLRQWKHPISATRPVVNDKALALWLCRKIIYIKVESTEPATSTGSLASQRHPGKFPHGSLNYFYGGTSGFPLANPFDFPASEFIFATSQHPWMCVYTSFSQDGFHWRGLLNQGGKRSVHWKV